MKKCSYCGKEYPDDASVCTIDETELECDQPKPAAESEASLDPEPIQADDGSDVPEGFRPLGSLDPFDADRLLRQFEEAGIRFLIDRIEQPTESGRGIRKRALIEIYVHNEDDAKANAIFSEDWKV